MVSRTSPGALFIKQPEQRDWDPCQGQLWGDRGATGLFHHPKGAGTTRNSANFPHTLEQRVLDSVHLFLLAGCPDFHLILPVKHDVLRKEGQCILSQTQILLESSLDKLS